MKILVTGGAGFIGSNFIYYMLDKHPEDEIVALDVLTYAGDLETLAPLFDDERFTFVRGDISDRDAILDVMDDGNIDVIVNFAAESHVDRSIEDPGLFIRSNVLGTQVLLDAAMKYGVKRFHQISTDEVYGDLPLDRPDLFFTEDTPIQPSSPYSASKAASDLLVMAYYRTFGLPATISRCSNNYGPYQFPEKLIPLVITNALGGKNVPVYGEGKNVRDWLFVDDHCAAVDRILEAGTPGEVYNIGGHNEHENIMIVTTILDELGKSHDLITYVKDRPGHDQRYAIDPSKMRRELGWEPTVRFGDGIKDTIQWYVDHPDWWNSILTGEYKTYEREVLGDL